MVMTRPPQTNTAQDKDLVDDAQIQVEFIRVRGRKSGAGFVALVCWSVASMTLSMTLSSENATTPKSPKSKNSNSSVQIQIKPKSQFECSPRDTVRSEFVDLVDFGGATRCNKVQQFHWKLSYVVGVLQVPF